MPIYMDTLLEKLRGMSVHKIMKTELCNVYGFHKVGKSVRKRI